MTNPLTTHTQTPQSLDAAQIAQLYTLYQTYYGGTSAPRAGALVVLAAEEQQFALIR